LREGGTAEAISPDYVDTMNCWLEDQLS
jgi:hypothetical protein